MKYISFVFAVLLSIAGIVEGNCPNHDKDHNHDNHKHHHVFKRFGEPVTISMTMTIPALSGPLPLDGNFNVTPFAIAPNGKVFKGASTNIVPAIGLIIALNPVEIAHPIKGNYTIGYYLALGEGSPVYSNSTIANFSGVLLNNPVGGFSQTITFPVQTLFLASSQNSTDVLTVTTNFPVIGF